MKRDRMTAGVIGRPIRHSLSPLLHNAWLKAAEIEATYLAFSPAEGEFELMIDDLRRQGLKGLNVTLPFKEDALALADVVSTSARRAGAANLILFREDGKLAADNTDGVGLLGAFLAQAPNFDVSQRPVALLGAGGAARGAASALIEAGAPEVRLVNRTRAKAEEIQAFLAGGVTVYNWDQVDEALRGAGALINATSLGLEGHAPLDLPLDALPLDAVVMDMVYRPLQTPLLVAAATTGRVTVDGLEMLIQQAIPSFRAFFGQDPPAAVDVRALALAALERAA